MTPSSASTLPTSDSPGRAASRTRPGAVDDGRLDADPARTTVEHEVDVAAEVGAHVGGSRRAHPAEAVGGRRGDPTTEGPQ